MSNMLAFEIETPLNEGDQKSAERGPHRRWRKSFAGLLAVAGLVAVGVVKLSQAQAGSEGGQCRAEAPFCGPVSGGNDVFLDLVCTSKVCMKADTVFANFDDAAKTQGLVLFADLTREAKAELVQNSGDEQAAAKAYADQVNQIRQALEGKNVPCSKEQAEKLYVDAKGDVPEAVKAGEARDLDSKVNQIRLDLKGKNVPCSKERAKELYVNAKGDVPEAVKAGEVFDEKDFERLVEIFEGTPPPARPWQEKKCYTWAYPGYELCYEMGERRPISGSVGRVTFLFNSYVRFVFTRPSDMVGKYFSDNLGSVTEPPMTQDFWLSYFETKIVGDNTWPEYDVNLWLELSRKYDPDQNQGDPASILLFQYLNDLKDESPLLKKTRAHWSGPEFATFN